LFAEGGHFNPIIIITEMIEFFLNQEFSFSIFVQSFSCIFLSENKNSISGGQK